MSIKTHLKTLLKKTCNFSKKFIKKWWENSNKALGETETTGDIIKNQEKAFHATIEEVIGMKGKKITIVVASIIITVTTFLFSKTEVGQNLLFALKSKGNIQQTIEKKDEELQKNKTVITQQNVQISQLTTHIADVEKENTYLKHLLESFQKWSDEELNQTNKTTQE